MIQDTRTSSSGAGVSRWTYSERVTDSYKLVTGHRLQEEAFQSYKVYETEHLSDENFKGYNLALCLYIH